MKRLTISMSDNLFDSLSKIQNKSLFVRKIIEQELDAGFGEEGATPSSRDLDALRDEIGRLTDRLHGLEEQIDDIHLTLQSIPEGRKTELQSTQAVETKNLHDETMQGVKPLEVPVSKFSFEIPDIKPAEQIQTVSSIAAPEKQSDGTTGSPFVIPDLKLSEEPESELSIAMPDFKPAEGIPADSPIAAPEKPSDESTQPPFEIPVSKLPEKMAQSSLFSQNPAVPAFKISQPETVPSPTPSSKVADKKDRLEGNILMYMPHGAEIKRDIVKSLLSTRYDSVEIDAKINQMIADNTLSAVTREGKDYLVRL